ncbi:MAG TPA: SpoIIE family protein phosphatase [Thermoanaerobaculia bacterium]
MAASRLIRRTPGDRRFVTLALAELTPEGIMRLVRAGHLPPLVVRADGSTQWLAPRGLALGLGRDGRFAEPLRGRRGGARRRGPGDPLHRRRDRDAGRRRP